MEKLKKLRNLYDSLDNILENWYNEDEIDEKIKFHTIIIALNTILVFEKTENDLILYIYDAAGYAVGMQYRASSYAADVWDVYWFDRNMFGDIVAVYDQEGVKLARYTYDAWGVPTVSYSNGGASTSVVKNSLRYRGYYYDADLGMYYLQSRYYDAKICRFINADGYISTGQGLLGYNMFAYCNNNPINCVDYGGNAPGAVMVSLVGDGGMIDLYDSEELNKKWEKAYFASYYATIEIEGEHLIQFEMQLIENFDSITLRMFYEQLYIRSLEKAGSAGVDLSEIEIMSVDHIAWETNWHLMGKIFPNTETIDLNYNETRLSMINRAFEHLVGVLGG